MKKLLCALCIVLVLFGVGWFAFLEKAEYATQENGWNLMLVNDDYLVPKDYTVKFVKLDNGERVDERVFPDLQRMFEAAEKEDIHMVVAEGYRTSVEQQEIMNEKVQEYQEKVAFKFIAKWYAKRWVAIPGTSEHQLGLAVDINADGIHNTGTQVYDWLAVHAHEYGFIQRYPENKTELTGIRYEPWHYRYVGDDVAKEIYEDGICLEEYIDRLD